MSQESQSTAASPSLSVEHDQEGQRFVADPGDGQVAELSYRPRGEGVVEMPHTFVPESLRDQGLAGRLAEAALGWARNEGLEVIPTCRFVSGYIDSHPEYQDLVQG